MEGFLAVSLMTRSKQVARRGWIGFDLDGTLAFHGTGDSIEKVGPPVPRMLEIAKTLIAAKREIRIVTARVSRREEAAWQRALIEKWCLEHLGKIVPVTNEKDYAMISLFDDRAVAVERNTGRTKSFLEGAFVDE